MIETRRFSLDPETGSEKLFHYDHDTDDFIIETIADVEPVVELAKYAANNGRGDWKGENHHVASIPFSILPELEKQGIMTAAGKILDAKKLKAWLNERDNQAFRVKHGRV